MSPCKRRSSCVVVVLFRLLIGPLLAAAFAAFSWADQSANGYGEEGETDALYEQVFRRIQSGELLLRRGEEAAAKVVFSKLYQELSDTSKSESLGERREYLLGVVLTFQDKRYVAMSHFGKALEANPSDARSSMALAKLYQNNGKLDRAADVLKSGLDAQPQLEVLKRALGELYKSDRRVEKAIEVFVSLHNDFPEKRLYFNHLLELYVESGDVDRAKPMFESLVNSGDIAETDMHFRLAGMLLDNGRYREASRHLQSVKRLEPTHPLLGVYMGRFFGASAQEAIEKKQFARAQLFLERALDQDENRPDLRQQLGYVYLEQENYEAAEAVFSDLLKEKPTDAEVYVYYAESLNELGKYQLAYDIVDFGYELALSEGDRESSELFVSTRRAMDERNASQTIVADESGERN